MIFIYDVIVNTPPYHVFTFKGQYSHSTNLYTQTVTTLLGTPVQSNAIQCNYSARSFTLTKLTSCFFVTPLKMYKCVYY